MTEMLDAEVVLQGLFLYLNRKGFKLSVRDYDDALQALRIGYGLHRREELLWLCETLWTRTDEEKRILNMLFNYFPYPVASEADAYVNTDGPDKNIDVIEPSSSDDFTGLDDEDINEDELETHSLRIQFSPTNETGVDLPRAIVTSLSDETYILTPQQIIDARELAIIWRRYREASRTGPKVEIDIEATINEKCYKGFINEPIFQPARSNQAIITVLIDVSTSMLPWDEVTRILVNSLNISSNQAIRSKIYYFSNVPFEVLYRQPNLIEPISIVQAIQTQIYSTLLIFSDAGAARGTLQSDRITDTQRFVKQVSRYWRPIVWINPMPKYRWNSSSAQPISKLTNISMLELNEDNMVKAVDILRGLK